MVGSESADYFMLRLGTPHPTWALTDDSNMIGIGNRDGVVSALFELDRNQIARIRALGQSVERIRCICDRAGAALYLHGRQVSPGVWAGVASADPDYLPTAAMISTWTVPTKPCDAFKFPSVSARVVASVSPA